MKFAAALLLVALPVAASAQNPLPPSQPLQTAPPIPAPPSIYEPTLYCLYNGIPYTRGSRLYEGGFAMSCDSVATSPTSLIWQLVR